MANELTTTGPNPYEAYGEAAAPKGNFLKFSKGDYVAGIDGEIIPIGTIMIADMTQLSTGWVRWQDGQVSDRIMGLLAGGFRPPRRNELGDQDESLWERDRRDGRARDPWQRGTELPMIVRDNPDESYLFVTGSKGGEGAIGELCKVYGKRIRTNPNDLPMVRLDVDSYQHRDKSLGRIKIPTLEVVGWINQDNFNAPEAAQDAPPPPKPAVENRREASRDAVRPDGTSPRNQPAEPRRAPPMQNFRRYAPDPVVEDERAEQASKGARRQRYSRLDSDDDMDVPFR